LVGAEAPVGLLAGGTNRKAGADLGVLLVCSFTMGSDEFFAVEQLAVGRDNRAAEQVAVDDFAAAGQGCLVF